MQRFFTLFVLFALNSLALSAQTTIEKNGKTFFNGDERHLRVYLNNNYDQLDPIEGIWIFTRIEYNAWGGEVSRIPNEFKAAIVRDKGNYKRAFVEVNMDNRIGCKEYQITYNIHTGGGNGIYPCEPEGCMVASGQYVYNSLYNTISRPAISLMGNNAQLVGVRIFPQGVPTELLPEVGGTAPENTGQVTKRDPHIITHPSGWEPHIDWDNQIFSSYILSMATANPKNFPVADDYRGDPVSVVGIVIKNPKYNSSVEIEIGETRYSKGTKQTFELEKRGEQYAIFPKVSWDYEALRCLTQAIPLDITFNVSINGKDPVTQTVTANLRAIDDCPLIGYDYRGDKIDLKFMAAAFVNEGSPIVKELTKEIRDKGLVRDFDGILSNDEKTAIQQVYAFWRILRDKGISYSNIANNGQANLKVASQRIRLLEDVMNETQANCVDGTALFASCLSAIGIPPIVVFVPKHAFLGFTAGYVKTDHPEKKGPPIIYFLETTMLGGSTDNIPEVFYEIVKTEPYSSMRAALYEKFNKGKSGLNREIDYFIFAIIAGEFTHREQNKVNPYDVMLVDIDQSRLLVKPIYRCNELRPALSIKEEPRKGVLTDKDGIKGTTPPTYGRKESPKTPMPSPTKLLRKGTESYDNFTFQTEAADTERETYKVQIDNTSNFQAYKYTELQGFGNGKPYAEYVIEKNRYRIMLGDFESKEKALGAAKKAQSLGFDNVAIVRYQKGDRYESIYRDWKKL